MLVRAWNCHPSNCRVKNKQQTYTCHSLLPSCLACSWTLKMKALCYSETSVNIYRTTPYDISEAGLFYEDYSSEMWRGVISQICTDVSEELSPLWTLVEVYNRTSEPICSCYCVTTLNQRMQFVRAEDDVLCLKHLKRVRYALSRQTDGRKVLCVPRDLWYGDQGF
jgi:hypothetical protein